MNLMKIASAVSGHVMGGDVVFDQVTTDTRVLSGGELFVALTGDHYDGHDFIPEALDRGAKVVIAFARSGCRNAS